MNSKSIISKKMSFRSNLIFNLLLWLCSFALLLIIFTEGTHPKTIDFIYTGSFLSTIIVPVLINFYILIPLLLKREHYFFYTLSFVLNILLFSQLNIWFFEHFIDYIFPDYYFISYHSNITLFAIFSIFLIITTLIKLSVDWFYFNSFENRELKIKNQQIQSQLALLRSQINPHFLFNSLNVIYALAIENKAETKDAIVQLSDILRYVIYDSNTNRIPLKDELLFLNNYIAFQKFRNKDTDNIKLNVAVENDNFLIYPMLLLPLIENSFKYGEKGNLEQDFIRMNFLQKDNEFLFQIENSYIENGSSIPNEYSGVGIENIKKNLKIVYPNSHEFNITKTKNLFSVTLKLFNHENKLYNS